LQTRHDADLSVKKTEQDSLSVVAKQVLPHSQDTVLSSSLPRGSGQLHEDEMPQKSIHHFCVLPDGLQMPTAYRGVWQQHHRTMVSEVNDLLTTCWLKTP